MHLFVFSGVLMRLCGLTCVHKNVYVHTAEMNDGAFMYASVYEHLGAFKKGVHSSCVPACHKAVE